MLQYTAAGNGARFMGIVHHHRCRARIRLRPHSHIGRLDKALEEGTNKGWTIVDTKRDWKVIFPFEKK
jgi:hypothetical protein